MKRLLIIFFICLGSWGYEEVVEVVDISGPMEKEERDALFSALQGLLGNSWNGTELFPDPCGWSPIPGVSCDLHGDFWYVEALYIGTSNTNKLSCDPNAEFRKEFFQLKYLKTLSINNCFTSTEQNYAPLSSKDWKNLASSLESLEFRSNPGLTQQIPTILGTLTNLRSLILMQNGFVGEIPENFGDLVKLKQLVLSENSLTGRIPQTIGRLKKLLILDVNRNLLSESLPSSLGNLTSLLKLDLSNNQLSGSLPSEIADMRRLVLMDLSHNLFSGGLISSFKKMELLEEMILSNNPFGGTLAGVDWKNLGNVGILDLSDMGLEGEIPESLSEMKSLRFLGLSRNNLTGNPPEKLANLPAVTAMYLNGNNLSGELNFSGSFYGKLRRRFGAWDNPNLCYWKVAANNTLFGVKPCQREVRLMELDSRGDSDASGGGVEGIWWEFVFLVKALMMVLLLNNRLL